MAVSVVIPLYNKAEYVSRALDSVRAQAYGDWECVVVNDGSTDGSEAVAARYAEADPRIRVVSQSNQGVSAARNRGIKEARSDWIGLLDADDEWHPEFLSAWASAVERYPAATAVFTNFLFHGQPRLRSDESAPSQWVEDYFRFWRDQTFGICSSSVVVRRSVLEAVKGFPVGRTMGEDLETWFKLGCVARFVFIPRTLATWHRGIGVTAARPPVYDLLPTYREWSRREAIPAALRESAREVAIWLRMEQIRDALDREAFSEARKWFRGLPLRDRWSAEGRSLGRRACAPLIPFGIRRFVRDVRRRVWGRGKRRPGRDAVALPKGNDGRNDR